MNAREHIDFDCCYKEYNFGVRQAIFAPLLGNGIFTQEGPAWKHSRELLRKQFIQAQYQNLNHIREHVDNLLAHLPSDGIIDLQPLFFNLTLDTTTALLFGCSVYSLRANIDQDADNKLFAESFGCCRYYVVLFVKRDKHVLHCVCAMLEEVSPR